MKYVFPFTKRRLIAEDVYELTLDTSSTSFSYRAGQYVYIKLPFEVGDSRGNGREFSLVSSPTNKGEIAIAFRDTGSGFKRALLELPIGSSLEIEGPFGTFTFPETPDEKILFIAGGIGIAPFISMLRSLKKRERNADVSLIYTYKDSEKAAYLEEIESFVKEDVIAHFITQTSRLTQEDIICQVTPDYTKIYVSGPPAMVSHTYILLRESGVSSKRIRLEEFTGYSEE